MNNGVVVGMSGGVDSSVAAAVLVEQGHEVTGAYIEAYNEPGCRAEQDKRDALRVATQLGIKFRVLDVRKEYKETVIKYFVDEYAAGRTPNPDVVCNARVKFGLFLEWAIKEGYEKVATGHYARVDASGLLRQPEDLTKDQTYFLWQVAPEKLARVVFPLGEMEKVEVRRKAKEMGLPNADKPDSMGVCMMGELDVSAWLKDRLGEKPGEVVWRGEVVGKHLGLWFVTIGQRGGWKLDPGRQTTKMPPLYVLVKDVSLNRVIVGERGEAYTNEVLLERVRWYGREGDRTGLGLRVRNLGGICPIEKLERDDERERVITSGEMFALAPGQSGVIYDKGGRVVGGGIIVV